MRLKKGLWSVMMFVVLSIMLVACGSEESAGGAGSGGEVDSDKDIVIGVAFSEFSDKWLSYLRDGMEEYAEEMEAEVDVVYVDAMNDATKQLAQVETFISQGVDAIAIIPVDVETIDPIVEKANEAGVPIIAVNRIFPNVEDATAFVGGNSIESGIIQMEEVAKLLDGKGKIAIMNGMLGHEATLKRTEGNKQVIDEYPDMEVVLEKNADFDRSKGMTLMENWLNSGTEFDAVVANNDEMAIGAIMALEAAGKLDEVIVAGIDGTIDALEYVETGQLDVSVFQDAAAQGRGGIEAAIKIAKGEEVEQLNFIPFELITKDNVEEFKAKWE